MNYRNVFRAFLCHCVHDFFTDSSSTHSKRVKSKKKINKQYLVRIVKYIMQESMIKITLWLFLSLLTFAIKVYNT